MSILQVQHTEKHFGDTRVLEDISFELEQGQALAIIGSSGSGKTTLLRCLNFLETPDRGDVYKRQALELENKGVDAVWNGMTLTDDVKALMATSEPYCLNGQVVVLAADVADQYQTVESLSGLSLSLIHICWVGAACGLELPPPDIVWIEADALNENR